MASRSEGKHAQSLASWMSTVIRPRPSHLHINRGASAAVNVGSGGGGRSTDCRASSATGSPEASTSHNLAPHPSVTPSRASVRALAVSAASAALGCVAVLVAP